MTLLTMAETAQRLRVSTGTVRTLARREGTPAAGQRRADMTPDTRAAQSLLLDMAFREAKRRTKKRNPPAVALAQVLKDLGFRLIVTSPDSR